mmetsp:Transcript_4711/g.10076  ORF Transcript_4711/g.10076 Transcript_4711/m.10076 type:complete len:207 (-) Transcript_4711:267-887(-)
MLLTPRTVSYTMALLVGSSSCSESSRYTLVRDASFPFAARLSCSATCSIMWNMFPRSCFNKSALLSPRSCSSFSAGTSINTNRANRSSSFCTIGKWVDVSCRSRTDQVGCGMWCFPFCRRRPLFSAPLVAFVLLVSGFFWMTVKEDVRFVGKNRRLLSEAMNRWRSKRRRRHSIGAAAASTLPGQEPLRINPIFLQRPPNRIRVNS